MTGQGSAKNILYCKFLYSASFEFDDILLA